MRRLSGFCAIIVAFLGACASCLAGEKTTLGRAVSPGQQISMDEIPHDAWNTLLARYVDDAGQVDYSAWKAAPADVARLEQYLDTLSHARLGGSADRKARLAFWINAYNAVTIRGILREYPTTSIRNHTPLLFGYHIWHDLLLRVGGRTFSLSQIEHDVLRKMGDPRIHFGIVCASRGCPRLPNEAYTAMAVEDQLDRNARHFFANPANFTYDAGAGTIGVSSIFDWFAEDFGADSAEQMRWIAPYLADPAARKLAASGKARLSYLKYDWSLNDQATVPAAGR